MGRGACQEKKKKKDRGIDFRRSPRALRAKTHAQVDQQASMGVAAVLALLASVDYACAFVVPGHPRIVASSSSR